MHGEEGGLHRGAWHGCCSGERQDAANQAGSPPLGHYIVPRGEPAPMVAVLQQPRLVSGAVGDRMGWDGELAVLPALASPWMMGGHNPGQRGQSQLLGYPCPNKPRSCQATVLFPAVAVLRGAGMAKQQVQPPLLIWVSIGWDPRVW